MGERVQFISGSVMFHGCLKIFVDYTTVAITWFHHIKYK